MANSASESFFHAGTSRIKRISSSFFSIPGFILGFSSRVLPDSDSARSPTSPLDFSFFSNLSNPFSQKSPRSPAQNGDKKNWDCSKVGLGIVKLLIEETSSTGGLVDLPNRKNIIFGSQVKNEMSGRSISLPKNYTMSLPSHTGTLNPSLDESGAVFEKNEAPLEPKLSEDSSIVIFVPNQSLSSEDLRLESGANTPNSLLAGGGLLQGETSSNIKLLSLPLPISHSPGYVASLSACEIEQSEDYTCIISHGLNPKTTHFFGDYILDCHTRQLSDFSKTKSLNIESSKEAHHLEGSIPYPSNAILSFCFSCKKKLEEGDDIYMYRGEKAFCSFECRSEEIFAEEEAEKTYDNSSKSSAKSSYHEDIFLMGLPVAT